MTGQISRIVTEKDTAKVVRSGSLPVLATPILSAVMEEAACKALASHLSGGETTVGGSMHLIHNAPTLPGHTFTATATVSEVKGRKITFQIVAADESGDIGEAIHERFLVDGQLFMEKAAKRADSCD